MSRTPTPIDEDATAKAVLMMIVAHRDKPCPTRREVQQWTGIPRRRVWRFLHAMQERGLIEIEERICERAGQKRLRCVNGEWTGWTGWTARRVAPKERAVLLERMRESADAGA